MKKRVSLIVTYIIFIFLFFSIVLYIYTDLYGIRFKMYKINSNLKIVNGGKINSCSKRVKKYNEYVMNYEYLVNNNRYLGKQYSYFDFKKGYDSLLFSKKFPIAYEADNESNSHLLIIPTDFSNFNLDFPDSLKFVKQLILDEDLSSQ